MAKYKFHITKKGEPGICTAQYSCPLGGQDEHYDSKESAYKAYEEKMTSELIPAGVEKDSLKLKDLNELAKVSSDREVLFNALSKGSDRTLKNMARNPNMDKEMLMQAYDSAGKIETKLALAAHDNFPLEHLAPEVIGKIYYDNTSYDKKKAIMGSDFINDAHIDAIQKELASRAGRDTQSDTLYALRNPNNQLSQDKVVALAERGFTSMDAAIASNRYPADRIPTLDEKLVYWATIDQTNNAEYLDAYATWATQRISGKSDYVASRVASNPATSPATLQTLADEGLALAQVYKHPHADASTKEKAIAVSPEVARMAKIDELDKQYPNGLKNELLVIDRTNQPYQNRGIYDTSVMLDTEKVKQLGLTKADIFTLMGANNFNGGVSYNEETGVFTGTVDSTD